MADMTAVAGQVWPAGGKIDYSSDLDLFDRVGMVKRAKELFQSDMEVRKRWCAFCDMHGGSYQVDSHEEAFLATFYTCLEVGDIPEYAGVLPPLEALLGQMSVPAPPAAVYPVQVQAAAQPGVAATVMPPPPPVSPSAATAVVARTGSGHNPAARVFVGGLPTHATDEAVRSILSPYGTILGVVMKYNLDGSFKGFCFVQFADPSSAQQAMAAGKAGQLLFEGRQIACREAVQKGNGSKGGVQPGKGYDMGKGGTVMQGMLPSANAGVAAGWGAGGVLAVDPKVFVNGLPRNTKMESVLGHFIQFGTVVNVDLQYNEQGGCQGFGYVTFKDKLSVDLVIANYANNVFEGKWIECKGVAGESATAAGTELQLQQQQQQQQQQQVQLQQQQFQQQQLQQLQVLQQQQQVDYAAYNGYAAAGAVPVQRAAPY